MLSKFSSAIKETSAFTPISVIIPCRNEMRGTLLRAMKKLETSLNSYLIDVLIIENGSDNLDAIPDTRYYFVEQGGLGVALKLGLIKAAEEAVFFLPADMSYDLTFVDFAILEDADMVIASKFVKGASVERPFIRSLVSKIYHYENKFMNHLTVSDATGAKMYRRSKILPLLSQCVSPGIKFEIELIKAAQAKGLKIKELPAIVHDYGQRGIFRWL
jgi:glycosyltransferase involved in cell wall biosynthesis